MPGEFEPVDAVWVTPPHNPETWPGCLDRAQAQFEVFLTELERHAEVRSTASLGIKTNDSWVRDYGPIFVTSRDHGLACHDFVFNCWGSKYEPYEDDNRVPTQIADHLQIPAWTHRFVLEGGSIDVNGRGTVLTTEQCLLNRNRNPGCDRSQIEHVLHDTLGTHHVVWLPGGIKGDDTDGHVDDVARFISPDTVVALRTVPGHPDHEVLDRNWATLTAARNQDGRKLNLVELPSPEPIYYDFPAEANEPGGRKPVPASYANFLIANQAVFLPVFGQRVDEQAIANLERAMPRHTVVPIRCEHLVVGLGALHCLTQQQPSLENSTVKN